MTLVIQTNIPGRLDVWLYRQGKLSGHRVRRTSWHSSEFVLPMVRDILQQQRLGLGVVRRIVVVRGPGPFTAVRAGIIVANTLGWIRKIPVTGVVTDQVLDAKKLAKVKVAQKKYRPIRPSYGRKPNITRPKT